ncbi:MAG: acyl-CoA thioesterase [Rhodospirillaceae bacterium]|jgi:acyl-CoA thioesterase YciA|nr:acyl-CoA thioesterase [Rhodospirillaceae bacterium]MBT5945220.1 acyl-CoA thioesterase [Rhodospirillaceae bacterium]MBT6403878.1 acyl-CoA thioesterase [Rhodospirillaceae bacterium]MBT6534960.1 acyl-CoA thioesterase [Rhodospirillaceae bacterium]
MKNAGKEAPGEQPRGDLFIQTAAMPADTNPNGDIFGGWLLSQMDIAGGIAARIHSGGRTVTIAVESMTFKKPVQVGDVVSCYAEIERVGKTSMTFLIEVWTLRVDSFVREKVTEGVFTYVAIGPDGRPREIEQESTNT